MSEQKVKSISFSEYSCYKSCQHKWFLNYHLKLPSDTNEELIFGSALHATIESLFGNDKLQRLLRFNPDETIKNIFKSALKDELSKIDNIQFLEQFSKKNLAYFFLFQALELIKNLDFHKRFAEYEIADLEIKLDGVPIIETSEVKITYKGFIDLVLKHKTTGRYLIIDWKSSRKPWDIKKKEDSNKDFYAQLILYKHFYSIVKEIKLEDVDTKFYNLPRDAPKEQDFYNIDVTENMRNEFLDNFKTTVLDIYNHSQTLTNFSKIKFITKKNYCYNCAFNTVDLCNEFEEYQIVKKP